jgi:hypothetical protein
VCVVALARTPSQPGALKFDFQMIIALRSGRRVERNLIVGTSVWDATLEELGNFVASIQRKATRLDGNHLESEVAQINLIGFADPFYILPIASVDAARASRVDAKECDVSVEQLI